MVFKKETKVKKLRIKPSTFARFGGLMPDGEDSDAFFNRMMDVYQETHVKIEEVEAKEEGWVEIPLPQIPIFRQPAIPVIQPPIQQIPDIRTMQQLKELQRPIKKQSFFSQWNWKLISFLVLGVMGLIYFALKVFV